MFSTGFGTLGHSPGCIAEPVPVLPHTPHFASVSSHQAYIDNSFHPHMHTHTHIPFSHSTPQEAYSLGRPACTSSSRPYRKKTELSTVNHKIIFRSPVNTLTQARHESLK